MSHKLRKNIKSTKAKTLVAYGLSVLLFASACDEWRLLPKPDLHRDVNRFGHSAMVSNG